MDKKDFEDAVGIKVINRTIELVEKERDLTEEKVESLAESMNELKNRIDDIEREFERLEQYRDDLEELVEDFEFEDMAPREKKRKRRDLMSLLSSVMNPKKEEEIEDPETGRLEAYWDGGYTGNPALYPLFASDLPRDILVVNINPLLRDEVPTSARAIQNRINEISFNSSLLRELRAIEFVQRLIDEGRIEEGRMKRVLVHMISDDALMGQLSVATKIVPVPAVLHQLRAAGVAAADAFLEAHLGQVGTESSVDLRAMFG